MGRSFVLGLGMVVAGCFQLAPEPEPEPEPEPVATPDAPPVDERPHDAAVAPDAAPAADASPCLEAVCVAVSGAYVSHYNGANCTGIESYYTPYFSMITPPMPN